MLAAVDLTVKNRAFDLRDTWQARTLAQANGRMMLVMASVLAHIYDVEPLITLFNVIRPRCWDVDKQSIKAPFLCSAGKIDKGGHVVADVILADGLLPERKFVFASLQDMEYEFRKLADQTRLSDADRLELFAAAKKWIVCDFRLDPAMDPQDPDAKRLVH